MVLEVIEGVDEGVSVEAVGEGDLRLVEDREEDLVVEGEGDEAAVEEPLVLVEVEEEGFKVCTTSIVISSSNVHKFGIPMLNRRDIVYVGVTHESASCLSLLRHFQ